METFNREVQMRKFVRVSCVCSVVLVLIQTTMSAAANGSFESGDFDAWTLSIPNGVSVGGPPPFERPAGTAEVVSFWQMGDMPAPAQPVSGSCFAVLGSLDLGFFSGEQNYVISLRQTISLNQGDLLSGRSFFYNGDFEAQDAAWVKLYDLNGNEIANLWYASSGDSGIPFRSATEWTTWEWLAPSMTDVTLELAMFTGGDNRLASYGFFDDINVTPVPEPSGALLLFGGLAAVFALRKKLRAS